MHGAMYHSAATRQNGYAMERTDRFPVTNPIPNVILALFGSRRHPKALQQDGYHSGWLYKRKGLKVAARLR